MNHLCIGSANFDQLYGIKNSTRITNADINKTIINSFENKNYYLDTSPTYGNAEKKIGDILSKNSLNEKAQCISKIDHRIDINNTDLIYESIRNSLKNLHIKSLWSLLLHRIPSAIDNKFYDFIYRLKEEKVIEHFGISVYNPNDAVLFATNDIIDIIQVPFNCIDRRLIDNNFFGICKDNEVIPMVRSIYLQGALLMDKKSIMESKISWAQKELNKFFDFCENSNIDPLNMCINSINHHLNDSIIVIGFNNYNEYKESLNIFNNYNNNYMFDEWWNYLPRYSNRLLNPTKW